MSIETTRGGRLRVRTGSGPARASHGTAATRREAELVEREAQEQRAAAGGPTLASIGRAWLDRRELDGVRGIDGERGRWRVHVEPSAIAGVPLDLLSVEIVEAFVRELQARKTTMRHRAPKPLSPKTVREILGLVRIALDDAGVHPNPVAGARKTVRAATKRKGVEATVEPWTFLDAEEQRAIATCSDLSEHERAIIAFAIATGLRQGEQTNLELRDVHLDDEAPHIVVRFGAKGQPPKNGRVRRVYLTPDGARVARAWLALLPTWARANPHGLAFPTRGGSRCSPGKHPLWRATWDRAAKRAAKVDGFKAALRTAGIARAVRWHDLRHTCASSLVAGWWGRRWTLEEAREHLGHTSIQSTHRYAHLGDATIKRAASETVPHAAKRAPSAARLRSNRREKWRVRSRKNWVGREGLEPSTNGLKASGDRDADRGLGLTRGQVSGYLVAAVGALVGVGGPLAARARAALAALEAGDPLAPAMLGRLLEDVGGAATGQGRRTA